jgi:hypothetical protein
MERSLRARAADALRKVGRNDAPVEAIPEAPPEAAVQYSDLQFDVDQATERQIDAQREKIRGILRGER